MVPISFAPLERDTPAEALTHTETTGPNRCAPQLLVDIFPELVDFIDVGDGSLLALSVPLDMSLALCVWDDAAAPSAVRADEADVEPVPPLDIGTVPSDSAPDDDSDSGVDADATPGSPSSPFGPCGPVTPVGAVL